MVIGGIFIGYKLNETGNEYSFIDTIDLEEGASDLSVGRVEEIIRFIDSKYVDSIDQELLLTDAIKNIVNHLDPHSVYLDSKEAAYVNDQVAGEYKGIGIETKIIGDTVYIAHVLPDSPAKQVGLQVYDIVTNINGISMFNYKEYFDSISASMKKVEKQEIDINRGGSDMRFSVNKEMIPVNSCENFFTLNDTIAYIEIKRFSENTYREFMDALESLVSKGNAKHLIIDVRDNGGGLLPEVAKILSQLINEEKQLLVYTEGLKQKREEYRSTGKVFFPVEKIAVLINNQSASGSEILAGAIQDLDRGIIIGARSFGKGLVQEQYALKNKSALRLTVAKYFTPSGRSIQKPFDQDYVNLSAEELEMLPVLVDTTGIDSTEKRYRTLYLNRMVYSNGGIDPDVKIDDQNQAAEIRNDIVDLIIRKALSYEISLSDSTTVVNLLEDAKGFQKELPRSSQDDLEDAFAFAAYSPTYYHKYQMTKDSAVSAALSQFAKEDLFDY